MQTSSPRLGPGAAGSRGARENANVVTLIQEALCSGDARCVVDVMAAIGVDLRTERLN